jgi:UDP-N-acetylmuramyl pentapeptide synthase
MVDNCLAAICASREAGVDIDCMEKGLGAFVPVAGRMTICRLGPALTLLDDTYNANPASVEKALITLKQICGPHEAIAVLGDMLELGAKAVEAHRELGRSLARAGCMAVLFHGRHARDVRDGLFDVAWAGLFVELASPQVFLDAWKDVSAVPGVVLFKGSRAGSMETFLNALCAESAS